MYIVKHWTVEGHFCFISLQYVVLPQLEIFLSIVSSTSK